MRKCKIQECLGRGALEQMHSQLTCCQLCSSQGALWSPMGRMHFSGSWAEVIMFDNWDGLRECSHISPATEWARSENMRRPILISGVQTQPCPQPRPCTGGGRQQHHLLHLSTALRAQLSPESSKALLSGSKAHIFHRGKQERFFPGRGWNNPPAHPA